MAEPDREDYHELSVTEDFCLVRKRRVVCLETVFITISRRHFTDSVATFTVAFLPLDSVGIFFEGSLEDFHKADVALCFFQYLVPHLSEQRHLVLRFDAKNPSSDFRQPQLLQGVQAEPIVHDNILSLNYTFSYLINAKNTIFLEITFGSKQKFFSSDGIAILEIGYMIYMIVLKGESFMFAVKKIQAPIWDANPFTEDPVEAKKSDEQYKAWKAFYRDLLPSVVGLEWIQRYWNENVTYIFGKDVLGEGYRVSVFDSKGAVRHSARETIGELFRDEQFPFDGCELTVVIDTNEAECPGVCERCSLHDAVIRPKEGELYGSFLCQLGLSDDEIVEKAERIWENYGFRTYPDFIKWVNRTADVLLAGGTIPSEDMAMYRVFQIAGYAPIPKTA